MLRGVRFLTVLATTASLALPATVAAAGKTPSTGKFSGTVVPTFAISFTVSKNHKKVTNLQSNWEPTGCSGVPPASPSMNVRFPDATIKKGAFSASKFNETVKAKFVSSTRATGSVHVHFKVPGLSTVCDESGTFTARHK